MHEELFQSKCHVLRIIPPFRWGALYAPRFAQFIQYPSLVPYLSQEKTIRRHSGNGGCERDCLPLPSHLNALAKTFVVGWGPTGEARGVVGRRRSSAGVGGRASGSARPVGGVERSVSPTGAVGAGLSMVYVGVRLYRVPGCGRKGSRGRQSKFCSICSRRHCLWNKGI